MLFQGRLGLRRQGMPLLPQKRPVRAGRRVAAPVAVRDAVARYAYHRVAERLVVGPESERAWVRIERWRAHALSVETPQAVFSQAGENLLGYRPYLALGLPTRGGPRGHAHVDLAPSYLARVDQWGGRGGPHWSRRSRISSGISSSLIPTNRSANERDDRPFA